MSSRSRFVLSLCLLSAVALLIPHSVTQAKDDDEAARLLIKCKRSQVSTVLAALSLKGLRDEGVRVYDLDSMERLGLTGVQQATPVARPGDASVPALPDAWSVWQIIEGVMAGLRPPGQNPPPLHPQLRRFDLSLRRLHLTFAIADPDMPDKIRAVLQASPLRARARTDRFVEAGAISQHKGGLQLASFTLNFREHSGGAATGSVPEGISMTTVNHAATAANLTILASREKVEPTRQGYRTVSRKLATNPTTVRSLRAFVHNLSKSGLTPFEVHWRLLDDKNNVKPPFDNIGKATVEVGYRERHVARPR